MEVDLFILLLAAFIRVTCVGVVPQQSFDIMITYSDSRAVILRILFPFIKV